MNWQTLAPCAVLLAASATTANAQPTESWSYPTGFNQAMTIVAIGDNNPHLYLANKAGGIRVLSESDSQPPTSVTVIPKSSLKQLDAMNLDLEGGLLYVPLGDHFAAAGSRAGLAIIDVSNPASPVVRSAWATDGTQSGAGDVVVQGDFAYLGMMREGVQVLSVKDPDLIVPVTTFLPDIHYPVPNPNTVQHPRARGLEVAGNRLYVANDAGGLRIFDITDSSNPRPIGRYVNPAMPNKAQAFNNIAIDGTRVFAAVDYCGIEILDAADAANIRQIGWWNPWNCDQPSNIWFNSEGHINEMVFDPVKRRLYASAGDSALVELDVSIPAYPRVVTLFGTPKDRFGAWGMTLHNNRIYGTYIRTVIPFLSGWAGVKTFDLAEPGSGADRRRSDRRRRIRLQRSR